MKTFYKLIVPLGIISLFLGCQKEHIHTYKDNTSDRYIYFLEEEADSTEVSFFSYPGQKTINFPVVVKSSGFSNEDLEYRIVASKEYTTAGSEDYSMPEKTLFRGGLTSDTCYVRLNYSPQLDNTEVRLVLLLEENDHFRLGPVENRVAVIWFHNKVVRPDWWGAYSTVTTSALGDFTEKKYRLLMELIGIDLSEADYSTIRHYALVLKRYLAEQKAAGNTIYEDDGSEMTVPAGGK